MKDSYHHGNLRNALIEAGLKIINESGEDALSLRKVAAACGVSHAAPYAHFADKESLIEAIKQKVTDDFTGELERSVNEPGVESVEDAILSMGEAYIMFFRNKPDYFNFLFGKQKIQVHTDMTREYEDDYPPFI
ncbi:MAG: TetR/AcrR family transcriptional regulator, partial [Lachnospiraceae bacterium]|nr:TetR/AcrR family transcriptional regulator [Lachnospiraceae bacterium]